MTKSTKARKEELKKLSKTERLKVLHEKEIAKRDANIKKLHASGKYSYQALADKVGMSKSRVWFIIND